MAPLHLLTAGLGSQSWDKAAIRLERQARKSKWFASVKRYDEKTLDSEIPDFSRENTDFVRRSPRGFGYWLWRPYIIRKSLLQAERGSVILFLDAGCELNVNEQSSRRMVEYSDMALQTGLLIMRTEFQLRDWCKSDTLKLFDIPNDSVTCTIEPGVFFLSATPENVDLMDQWIHYAKKDNYHHLDDSPSQIASLDSFQEHRHDQAILTSLLRKRSEVAIPQETFFAWERRDNLGKNFPIWVVRNRSSWLKVSGSPMSREFHRCKRTLRTFARKLRNKLRPVSP